jgi:uncharacterized protein YqgC (DUF456 family)
MSPEKQVAIDSAIAAAGSKATYTGAGTIIGSWFLSSEFGILIGMLLGVGGFIVNWFYKHRADRRQQAEHDLKMRQHGKD